MKTVLAVVAALSGLLAGADDAVAAALELVEVRPLTVMGVSGITRVEGDDYLVICDHEEGEEVASQVRPLKLKFAADTGRIAALEFAPGFRAGENNDSEDIAWDGELRRFYLADERRPSIREFFADGTPTGREVPVPEMFLTNWVFNLTFESLALSPDGRWLWTANEQALPVDGPRTDTEPRVSPLVRILGFRREQPGGEWRLERSFAYRVDPSEGMLDVANGVAAMLALADGSLLVLEREVSTVTSGRARIYRLGAAAMAAASEIAAVPALANARFTAVAKGKALVDFDHRRESSLLDYRMRAYEGMCLGPVLADGSQLLILVADGGEERTRSFLGVTARARTLPEIRIHRMRTAR